MAETAMRWAPRGAWAGIAPAGAFGAPGRAGIAAHTLEGFGLATLSVPPDGAETLAAFAESRLGLALPATPETSCAGDHALIWSGSGQWLLRARSRDGFPALLAELSSCAAVADQSDARAGLRLGGAKAREVLAKGVMIDLHPAVFPVGAVALTSIAHVDATLRRCEDEAGEPVFEILVARSMAGSFWSWFSASAAEFGCEVAAGRG